MKGNVILCQLILLDVFISATSPACFFLLSCLLTLHRLCFVNPPPLSANTQFEQETCSVQFKRFSCRPLQRLCIRRLQGPTDYPPEKTTFRPAFITRVDLDFSQPKTKGCVHAVASAVGMKMTRTTGFLILSLVQVNIF